MHVIQESDEWLHVIVPDAAVTWQTNWTGVYGYVRKQVVTQGKTLAEIRWK